MARLGRRERKVQLQASFFLKQICTSCQVSQRIRNCSQIVVSSIILCVESNAKKRYICMVIKDPLNPSIFTHSSIILFFLQMFDSDFKVFRYSFSEVIPTFFNRFKNVFFPCSIAMKFSPVIGVGLKFVKICSFKQNQYYCDNNKQTKWKLIKAEFCAIQTRY